MNSSKINIFIKRIIRRLFPARFIEAIKTAKNLLQYRKIREKPYPSLKGMHVVGEARQHLQQVTGTTVSVPPSTRWQIYLEKIRSDVSKLATPKDVISYAQSRVGFDHRVSAFGQTPYFSLYEDTLKNEFPHFSDTIDKMGDSPFSLPDTILVEKGRLVSNIFYFHLRYVLQCLTYIRAPRIVCEIGGGYGDPARLWLQNPIHRPKLYVIVDFPESLFFAEVFLRVNFDDLKLLYLTDHATLDLKETLQYSVVLCPVEFVDALSGLTLDLVVNTGSMHEMTEESVGYWMEWLKKQDCRYFYSLNFFAQPLAYMAEGANTWSPRLTSDWVVRLQRFDPAFIKQQSPRNFAEILAEKSPVKSFINQEILQSRFELTQSSFLDGQALLEAMDVIRITQNEEMMWRLLQRCISEMRSIPKEAYYLSEQLDKHATPEFFAKNGKQLQNVRSQLHLIRSKGLEDLV
jgi:putative sugar O-methyltransferase